MANFNYYMLKLKFEGLATTPSIALGRGVGRKIWKFEAS